MPDDVEDAELVRRIAQRDTEALRALYGRYGRIVYGLVYRTLGDRQLAEDRTRDVFVTVWRSAEQDDVTQARVSTWLLTIARNEGVDRAAAEQGERVAAALVELPQPQLDVLSLAYFEGLSHGEIAARLDLPFSTVARQLRLALGRLRALAPKYALDAETVG